MASPRARRRASAEKSRPSVFWPLAAVILPLAGLLAKIEIEGEENLPSEGPYVLAPNHYSEIDPVIVAVATWRMGRAPRFMAKESLFRVPVLGWALRATGMIPVGRSASASASAKVVETAQHLTASGHGVIVYPEGSLTREPDMWPMRGKTGAARVALAGSIPVIPMAHWGVQQIMPRYGKLRLWPLRRRIRVVVGPPVDLGSAADVHPTASTLQAATNAIMDEVTSLLAGVRDATPPVQRWDPAVHGQRETGRLDS